MSKKPPLAKSEEPDASSDTSVGDQDLSQFKNLVELVGNNDEETIKSKLRDHLLAFCGQGALAEFATLVLHDEHDSISTYHANRIYEAASRANGEKPVLLIITSDGGGIEPAYLISKTCKRLAKERFIVAIPRRAKSAATLISLGADEIHMGIMSELGPIDPQIGSLPSLSLANAIEKIAELTTRHPAASDMFAKYLIGTLDLRILGYFERLGESATQYAARLLSGKPLPPEFTEETLAHHFVNHYKDHGFVIDVDEATRLLGTTVKIDTDVYRAANQVYRTLDAVNFLFEVMHEKELHYVGDLSSGLFTRAKRPSAS